MFGATAVAVGVDSVTVDPGVSSVPGCVGFDRASTIRGSVAVAPPPPGAAATVTVTVLEFVVALLLSVARADSVNVPAALGVNVALYGDVASVATSVKPLKKSTLDTVPSASVAIAVSVADWPTVSDVVDVDNVIVGGVFWRPSLDRNETAADVVCAL